MNDMFKDASPDDKIFRNLENENVINNMSPLVA